MMMKPKGMGQNNNGVKKFRLPLEKGGVGSVGQFWLLWYPHGAHVQNTMIHMIHTNHFIDSNIGLGLTAISYVKMKIS